MSKRADGDPWKDDFFQDLTESEQELHNHLSTPVLNFANNLRMEDMHRYIYLTQMNIDRIKAALPTVEKKSDFMRATKYAEQYPEEAAAYRARQEGKEPPKGKK